MVSANAHAVPKAETSLDVGYRLVVGPGDGASGHQISRCTGFVRCRDIHADHHDANVLPSALHLHGEVSGVAGFGNARHSLQAAPHVIAQAGRFGIGTERIALDYPQIGAAVVDQSLGVIDHAAINAGHGKRHTDEQAKSNAGECVFSP